nr:hypothetical protein [Tanacetum cinerariifolium]
MSLDDLCNHLKAYEAEVQNKLEPNTQNMAFISSTKHNRGNDEVNTTSSNVPTASANVATVSISQETACAYIASQSGESQIKFKDINQINEDNMEEMDIKWKMALLSMRADKFWKKTGKKISIQGLDVAGRDEGETPTDKALKLKNRLQKHSKMIPELGDANRDITVTENFHLQTDDELSDKELKQIEADDQAIQTILLGLPEDIYVAVDSCKTAQEIWLRVQQMMKGSDIGIQEKKAKLFNEWERFTSNEGESIESYYHRFLNLMNDLKRNKHFPEKIDSNLRFLNNLQPEWSRHVDELKAERVAKTQDPLALMANSNNPYAFPAPHQDQSSFNQNYLQQPMPNPEDITDPTTAMNMALALMAKAFKLNYSTPTNNNQRILSNPMNRQIAQPGNPAGYNDVIGNQVNQNVV